MFAISDLPRQSGEKRYPKLIQAVVDNNLEEVQKLIDHAKKSNVEDEIINIRDNEGRTPLYVACMEGYSNIVSLLINSKANINQAKKGGATPLFIASQNNKKDIVRLLLQHGADVNKAKSDGATPLYVASLKDNKDVVQILLQHDADMYKARNDGSTPAYKASVKGYQDVLRLLLEKGYQINHKSFKGYTVLHMAAWLNHHSLVQMLLTQFNGKNVIDDASNEFKHTPLTVAIRNDGDLEMVKLLIEGGANKNKVGYQNKTPLDWARDKRKTQIVEYLQKI